MKLKYCPECGECLFDEYKYCPECATDLSLYTKNFNANSLTGVLSGFLKLIGDPTVNVIGTESEALDYDTYKKKAKYYVLREKFDSALTIYNKLIEFKPDDVELYIGVVRATSSNYTVYEGEEIETAIRILNNVSYENDPAVLDAEYATYLYNRRQHFLRLDCKLEGDKLVKYLGTGSRAIIPDGITVIGDEAFIYNETLTEVVLPEGVITIGASAFKSCKNLEHINLPDSVKSIGEYAFYGCLRLKDIDIPEGVTVIYQYTFYQCESMKNVTLPESIKSIHTYAFYQCRSLEWIDLPEGLESIDQHAFEYCWALDLTVPSGVTFLGAYAFSYTSITELVIPSAIRRVEPYLCQYCKKLTSVTLHKDVIELSGSCFWGCESLKELEVPAGCSVASNAYNPQHTNLNRGPVSPVGP